MKIVYKNDDNTIVIITACEECLKEYSLELIALKDVPEGLPFWLVAESEIPVDRTFRNSWEIPDEWGKPDGHGSKFNTFKEIIDDKN